MGSGACLLLRMSLLDKQALVEIGDAFLAPWVDGHARPPQRGALNAVFWSVA